MALGPPIHCKWDGTLGTRVQGALSMGYYAEILHNFPHKYDGCDAHFSLALGCKKGALVMFRRNEIRDGLVNLASRAVTPSAAVWDKPLVHGCANENVKTVDSTLLS